MPTDKNKGPKDPEESREDKIRKALDQAEPIGFKATFHQDPAAQESGLNRIASELKASGVPENGMKRTASESSFINSALPGVSRTPLLYVDPMFDPILFLFPKDRIDEINKRLRHYYETDPIVGNAIDLHSQPAGELVFCNDGVSEIQDISIGDSVIGTDGYFVKVVGKSKHEHDGMVYKIKSMYLPPVQVTDTHPILAIPRSAVLVGTSGVAVKTDAVNPSKSQAKWFMAKDLRAGDVVLFPKFIIEKEFKPVDVASYIAGRQRGFYAWDDREIVTIKSCSIYNRIPRYIQMSPEFAEILGWYVAEGSCVGSTIDFTLGTHEQRHISRIAHLVEKLFGIKAKVYDKENNSSHVTCFSAPLARMLADLCGKGALNKRIPNQILFGKQDIAKSFLAAYLYGDGCLGFSDERRPSGSRDSNIVCNTVSRTLSYQLLLLGSKCGILFGSGSGPQKLSPNKLYWLSAPKRVVWSILYGIERDGKIKKCKRRYQEDEKYFYIKISGIESFKFNGTVHDIETEDHSFCAPFVVHNSTLPLSDFYLEAESPEIERYWNDWKDRTGLLEFLRGLVHDYFLLGEGFGLPIWDPANSEFSHFNQYPPENVDVFRTYVTPTAFFMLKPDPKLAEKVQSAAAIDQTLLNMMPTDYVDSLREGRPYLLGSDKRVMYLARQTTKYRNRGISILSRCLKDLLYQDKLRLLQLTFIDRHAHPIKIFKLGSESRGWIPNKKHFARLQQLLAQAANDPDFCFSEDTQLLTDSGWKGLGEFSDQEKLATFNPQTCKIEYHQPIDWNVIDYKGEMVHFKSKSIDALVTPNHRMWVRPEDTSPSGKELPWRFVKAKDLLSSYKFRAVADWDGTLDAHEYGGPRLEDTVVDGSYAGNILVATKTKKAVRFGCGLVELDDIMRLAGWYISEGCGWRAKGYVTKPIRIHIVQNEDSDLTRDMDSLVARMPFPVSRYGRKLESGKPHVAWGIYDQDIAKFLVDNFGQGSANKRIPVWMRMLPKEQLRILVDAMMQGDGTECIKDGIPIRVYYTSSRHLVDSLQEIVLKLGWTSSFREFPVGNGLTMPHYHVLLQSPADRRRPRRAFPLIKKRHISRVQYDGKVFCPVVPPHHLVFARRNGNIMVSGQSVIHHFGLQVDYVGTKDKIWNLIPEFEWVERRIMAGLFVNEEVIHGGIPSAVRDTVNLRTLMYRYQDIREKVERAMITHIFLPIAQARGFYRKAARDKLGSGLKAAHDGLFVRHASGDPPSDAIWIDRRNGLYLPAGARTAGLDISAYDIPRPIWKKLNLVNNMTEQQLLMKLEEDGKIPIEMVYDMLGLDARVVQAKMKAQYSTPLDPLWRQIRDEIGRDKSIRLQVLDGKKPHEWALPEGSQLETPAPSPTIKKPVSLPVSPSGPGAAKPTPKRDEKTPTPAGGGTPPSPKPATKPAPTPTGMPPAGAISPVLTEGT